MKTIVPCLLLMLLASCSKYQYLTIASDNVPLNRQRSFEVENDTVTVTYLFNQGIGEATISVFNKSEGALQVDWSKSSVITNQQAQPMHDLETEARRQVDSGSLYRDHLREARIMAIMAKTAVTYLPPGTSTSRQVRFYTKAGLLDRNRDVTEKKIRPVDGRGQAVQSVLTRDQSPLHFRIYLYVMAEQGSTPIVIDRSFYVSDLMSSGASPRSVSPPGDTGFLRTGSNASTVGIIFGLLAGVAAVGFTLAQGAGDAF